MTNHHMVFYHQEFIRHKPKSTCKEVIFHPLTRFSKGTKLIKHEKDKSEIYQIEKIIQIHKADNFIELKIINGIHRDIYFPDDFRNYSYRQNHQNKWNYFKGLWRFYHDPFSDWFKEIWLG